MGGLQVWANADYPRDAKPRPRLRRQGIGLCRTEHMFFEEERLPIVQRMILAKTSEERVAPGQAAAPPAQRLRGPLPRP
jgi:pyruvate,orthophosphate dikinase